MIIIREERPEDIEAIRRVNNEAFGQPAECRKRIVKAASLLGMPEKSLAALSYSTMMRERLKKAKR